MWCYSLTGDNKKASAVGILTGLAYTCMVATWGGFVFVLNMIGLHAFVLVLLGRFSNKLYWSYTLWYIVGTLGAIQVPVVGWTPVKSLEQLAPAGVFGMMQLLQLCENKKFLKLLTNVDRDSLTNMQRFQVRFKVFAVAGAMASVVIAMLWPTGYFGPLSSRVRGLFVTHTRTGNPLVDSVAEHQPASPQAFWQFLHLTCYTSPVGFVIALFNSVIKPLFKPSPPGESTDGLVFIVLYAIVSYHFSTKMNRLMLLMGPISASLSGIAVSSMVDFILGEISSVISFVLPKDEPAAEETAPVAVAEATQKAPASAKKKNDKATSSGSTAKTAPSAASNSWVDMVETKINEINGLSFVKLLYKVIAAYLVYAGFKNIPQFYQYSQQMGVGLSNPSLMFQARLNDGTPVMVDDYREAYWWLRDHTPEDARVMAWWDYGYQITGIGNRTTIADGNTWNHEVCVNLSLSMMFVIITYNYYLLQ
jgi:dolichyl-diphosphooligosaccharide--protein glycosyltransferase